MSVFSILGTGASGLRAHSFATNVAGHNTSNAATEGYSRRTTALQPLGPSQGGGVRAVGSRRVVDTFLQDRLLGARSMVSEAAARERTLSVLDAVLQGNAGLVGDALDNFESSLIQLSTHPNESAARLVMLSAANGLATAFQSAAHEIGQARADTNRRIASEVQEVNHRLHEVARLGSEISRSELAGQEASDLRDRRDQLLREVAEFAPIKVVTEPNGAVSVLLGGSLPIVSPDGQVRALEAAVDATTGDVQIFRTAAGQRIDVTAQLTGGSIGGMIRARDHGLSEAARQLDQLAYDVAEAYNAVHSAGVGLDGVTGRNLFDPPGGVTGAASQMRVSGDVAGQPDRIAAAQDAGGLPSDNRNALALQAISSSPIALGGTTSISQALNSLTTFAGIEIRAARTDLGRSEAAAGQLTQLHDQISGVSIDEEMIDMMRFQRAYQASLKVVHTADEMLQELLNLKR